MDNPLIKNKRVLLRGCSITQATEWGLKQFKKLIFLRMYSKIMIDFKPKIKNFGLLKLGSGVVSTLIFASTRSAVEEKANTSNHDNC